MTDSELIEHMHARGWNVGTIDVPMIREACKALAAEQNPWRQAVDEALIAHALDCTGPGDDPKEKVKELIEWAVTIATDPRVSETAAREQEASATGAEPAGWLRVESEGRESLDPLFLLCKTIPDKTHYRASYAPLFTYRHLREYGAIARQQGRDEMREWNASRVRDEALEEAAKMCESRAWRSLEGIAADIRSLIGTPESAEGEGA